MSKFNAKNLSYESNEPAFLRKLRGEYGGADSVRHARPLARPRKQAIDGDDDDQPTYVVEGSQDTISKQDYDALVHKGDDDGSGEGKQRNRAESLATTEVLQDEEARGNGKGLEPAKEQVAAIGGTKKKRNIVAIGADDQEHELVREEKKQPKAKKGKKVKLSFDEA